MEITSVTNIQTVPTNISTTDKTESSTASEIQKVEEENKTSVASTIEEETAPLENEKTASKGVIRNLLNGHFKGVSDIRLRINFQNEISALEQAELAKASEAGLTAVSEKLNNEINILLGSDEIDEETSVLIASALESLNSDISLLQNKTSQNENLLAQLRGSFDNFVLAINPAAEEIVETEPPVTGETESSVMDQTADITTGETVEETNEILPEETPQFSIDKFISDLSAAFESEMNLLETTLASTSVLPELSAPNGNGKAYDKFLAIYNDMRNNQAAETQDALLDSNSNIDITS